MCARVLAIGERTEAVSSIAITHCLHYQGRERAASSVSEATSVCTGKLMCSVERFV